jgi:CheY-like chemotaxis protein
MDNTPPLPPETVRFVHGLRNCMASVRAGASMLQNSATTPAMVARIADALQTQVREMVGLVDEFVGKSTAPESEPDSLPPLAAAPADAKLRILVADDNADAASTLAMYLRLEGHHVTVAFDGQQALTLAEADPPDIMLLDIGMPTRDGYEVAREVRSRPWGAHIQLIATTGWMSAEDGERATRAGFNGHLSKPIDMDVLQQMLRQNVRGGG